jgi:hypothetical protein
MGLGIIIMLMEHIMKVNGKMINKMVKDLKNGLMELVIEDIILKVKKRVRVYLNGLMDHITKENFVLMLFKEQGII